MSELERLEDETSNATPAERAPEVVTTSAEVSAPDATGLPAASEGAPSAETAGPALNPDGTPKKKRRRGSRGGRNRKKPNQGAGGQGAGGQNQNGQNQGGGQQKPRPVPTERRSEPGDDSPRVGGGEDWNDAAADRGLTDDDIALSAKEDAGLPVRGERPKIGDSRPSPKVTAPAAKAESEGGDAVSSGRAGP
ncbi:MAG TPA: hypothetical protein VNC41_05110 [Acidimicrobiia bacterium]|nr:hypothetical protein [Acidimicrobiia bacterium]